MKFLVLALVAPLFVIAAPHSDGNGGNESMEATQAGDTTKNHEESFTCASNVTAMSGLVDVEVSTFLLEL